MYFFFWLSPLLCLFVLDAQLLMMKWNFQQNGDIFQLTKMSFFEGQCEEYWFSIVSAESWQPQNAFASALLLSGASPPDWWSCLFLITLEIKYHASNIGVTKDFAAAGAQEAGKLNIFIVLLFHASFSFMSEF